MSTQNLGDVFGPAAASTTGPAGLAGRLPRVGTPAATPPAGPVAAPVAPPQAPAPTSPDDGTRQISVYVLPHVPDAIRAAKGSRTNAAVVYDAIERCQARLPELLAARRAAPAPAGALFTRQPGDARDDETRIPWTFKVTVANRRVLDRLVTTFAAASRSELVATALEAIYPPAPAPA